jgi:hypothetical protein
MAESIANLDGRLATDADTASVRPPTTISGSSSDTMHDNESFDEECKNIDINPLSTTTLNFDNLRIPEYDCLSPREDADCFAGVYEVNFKHHRATAPTYDHSVQQFRRNNHHFGPENGFSCGSGRQRNARIWMSEETRAAQEYLVIRNAMRRLFKNADVAKWKIEDYIAHREATMVSAAKKLSQQAQNRGDKLTLCVPPISPQQQDMMRRCGLSGNFDQVGNYGRALGEKTIWCEDWQNGKDEIAPWPCLAELKWEGDDRAKTGVGRFPPLPREQGPIGLPWNQLQAVEPYPLDQIARIPTMEDVYLPVDEIDDEVKYDLLNKDLEDAMNNYFES